jgi:glutamate-ammonia-ligase adenylyltransferase
MTRARCVLGSAALQARFDAVRQAVIATARDASSLRLEISAMRDKVRTSHPIKGVQFDVKHSAGGMVDVEFVVQFLVLSQGHVHPELLGNVGNIALLLRAQGCGLLPAGVGEQAAQAYRVLRQIQHRARLNEEPTQVPQSSVQAERAAGLVLWVAVFGTVASATAAELN